MFQTKGIVFYLLVFDGETQQAMKYDQHPNNKCNNKKTKTENTLSRDIFFFSTYLKYIFMKPILDISILMLQETVNELD